MPFGYVEAGAAVVGAVGSIAGSHGGGGQGPSAAGWITNAMALTDMMGTSRAEQFNPYNLYGGDWADQLGQARNLSGQASSMANQFNSGAQQLTNQQRDLSGQITNASNQYLNSGQQAQYQGAMNALQPAYYGAGQQAFTMGQQLQGQMGSSQRYGDQIMQTAFDPQKQLYDQQYQLQQQQAMANQASRGLAMSGVGAELSNQADQNFNINWQNQQLARQIAGLGAYDTNNQSIAGLAQGANQAYTVGLQDWTTGAGIPYNTAQTIYNNNQAAYGNQQSALTAEQQAFLLQQQTAQQGLSNQANMLTGQQTALANQQNNMQAGNAWYNQQEANLMSYYNGSAPTWNQGQMAATANGYAGLGNFIGSGAGQQLIGNGQTGLSGAYNNAYINNTAGTGTYDFLANQGNYGAGTPYNPYANASAWSMPDSSAINDVAGFAALGG